MINVADIHNLRDVTDIIEINVDDHRYVAIGKSRDSFWIVVGQRTLMQKSLVISRHPAVGRDADPQQRHRHAAGRPVRR